MDPRSVNHCHALPVVEDTSRPLVLQPGLSGVCQLKILVVNWRCIRNPKAGGAEVHLHRIFSLLAKAGHGVNVLCSGWRNAQPEECIDGIRYVRVGREWTFQLQYRRKLKQLVEHYRFNLIVDDISKVPLGVSRQVSLPTIGICHHIHGQMLFYELPRPLAAFINWREQQIPRLYHKTPILAVSNSTGQELIQMGISPNSLGLVHNGVDQGFFHLHRCPKSPQPLLVYLGRLQRYKNIECILRAMSQVRRLIPEAKLLVIGTGKHEAALKIYAEKYCSNGIEFTGCVSEEQKANLLSSAWISLASSIKEGWGISVIEANAAGTPVIASDVPGFLDSILHQKTGLLYPYDNDEVLAKAAVLLISNSGLRQQLSQSAEAWAANFSWEASAREFLDEVLRFYPEFGVSDRKTEYQRIGVAPIGSHN